MITEQTIDYLKLIFSDADVIDIDLSIWDNSIGIYVVADHVQSAIAGKRAILALRFRGVRRFDWSFHHHDFTKFQLKANRQQHLNWNVYRSELVCGEIYRLTVSGSEQCPILKIDFEELDIKEIDSSVFADVNPDWANPGSGFARPGIEKLRSLMKGS
jgi:hypothetical protein